MRLRTKDNSYWWRREENAARKNSGITRFGHVHLEKLDLFLLANLQNFPKLIGRREDCSQQWKGQRAHNGFASKEYIESVKDKGGEGESEKKWLNKYSPRRSKIKFGNWAKPSSLLGIKNSWFLGFIPKFLKPIVVICNGFISLPDSNFS